MTTTYNEAHEILTGEGWTPDDATSVLDQLIAAGLSKPQPDDGWAFTANDLDVARLQLRSAAGDWTRRLRAAAGDATTDETLVEVCRRGAHLHAARRVETACGHCHQPLSTRIDRPATWCSETQCRTGGWNWQHGCGAWNPPVEVEVDLDDLANVFDPERVVADALASLEEAVARRRDEIRDAVHAEVCGELVRAAAGLRDLGWDPAAMPAEADVTTAEADAILDVVDGWSDWEGVCIPVGGGPISAWRPVPFDDGGDGVTVDLADLDEVEPTGGHAA